jgi:hypothetical protein
MQQAALQKVQILLTVYWNYWPTTDDNTLHHGDCTGSDEQVFDAAKALGFATVAYPASDVDDRWRAKTESDIIHHAEPALKRNHTIVGRSNVLIAAVHGFNPSKMQERSGTWATIRYAKKEGVPFWLVDPLGVAQFYPVPSHRETLGVIGFYWDV